MATKPFWLRKAVHKSAYTEVEGFYALVQEARDNPQGVLMKMLPDPGYACPSCKAKPVVLVSAPVSTGTSWVTPGVPLLAYVSSSEVIDKTLGLPKTHCLIPIPGVSVDWMKRFLLGGPGFMCFSCFGYGRPLGLEGTVTAVTPRVWFTWLMKHGSSQRPRGLHKMDIKKNAEWSIPLSSLLVEFYLGTYIEHQARELGEKGLLEEVHEHLVRIVNLGAEIITNYLFWACLGESRHMGRDRISQASVGEKAAMTAHGQHLADTEVLMQKKHVDCKLCEWYVSVIRQKGSSSVRSREAIYKCNSGPFTKAEALAYLGILFRTKPAWGSGYGGPLWAMGAEIGSTFKEGDYPTNYSLCDRIFNITHNGGTIFSKSCGGLSMETGPIIGPILETKAKAKHFGEYAWMSGFASPELFKMYQRVSDVLLQKGGCVLWDAERRSGG